MRRRLKPRLQCEDSTAQRVDFEKTRQAIACIYPTMSSIKWPKSGTKISRTEAFDEVLLPELELTDADYEAAGKAWSKLDGCFFEVVFVHEVAARHCRERQLSELLRCQSSVSSEHLYPKDFVNKWKKPTPLSGSSQSKTHPFTRKGDLNRFDT
jgi:hypothetical protein